MNKKRIKELIKEEFMQRLAIMEFAAKIAEAELHNDKGQLLISVYDKSTYLKQRKVMMQW